jgi:hypothetical protein
MRVGLVHRDVFRGCQVLGVVIIPEASQCAVVCDRVGDVELRINFEVDSLQARSQVV